jgi:hypothetical protein
MIARLNRYVEVLIQEKGGKLSAKDQTNAVIFPGQPKDDTWITT